MGTAEADVVKDLMELIASNCAAGDKMDGTVMAKLVAMNVYYEQPSRVSLR